MQKPWENKVKVLSMQEYRAFENVLEEKKTSPGPFTSLVTFLFFSFFLAYAALSKCRTHKFLIG